MGYQTCKVWCSYLHSHLWWHSNEIHLPSYQNLACAIGETEYEFNWMNWKSWHFFIMLLHLTFYHWILTWEIIEFYFSMNIFLSFQVSDTQFSEFYNVKPILRYHYIPTSNQAFQQHYSNHYYNLRWGLLATIFVKGDDGRSWSLFLFYVYDQTSLCRGPTRVSC